MRIGDKWTITSYDEFKDTYDLEHDKTHAILTIRRNIISEAMRDCFDTRLEPRLDQEFECGDEKYTLDNYNLNDGVVYLSNEKNECRAMSIELFLEKWSPIDIDYIDKRERAESRADEEYSRVKNLKII